MTPPASIGPVDSGRLARRVLLRTAMVGVGAFGSVGLLSRWALLLAPELLAALALRGALLAAAAIVVALFASARVLRKNRYVLRSLALGSHAIEPGDVGALADLAFSLTLRFVVVCALAPVGLFVPVLGPPGLDLARAISLCLLAWTVIGASALVHYIAVREAALRVLERSPVEPITEWLEQQARRLAPRRRVQRKILIAVIAPVTLVGVGTLLVTHAHLRALVERERIATAVTIARAALEPLPGAVARGGRVEAIAAVQQRGYEMHIEHVPEGSLSPAVLEPRREPSGKLRVVVPLEDGYASARFGAELSSRAVAYGALATLLAVIIAALLGGWLGQVLAADLAIATAQVASLGTERALRGKAAVAGTARFGTVAAVGHSVETLAERFREFARAHEHAIFARESAQRMKELLFASVSHDLKSPLNAVLGLAELVREEPLTEGQAESLDIVVSRGRELLALIETILDAARVEAGQLELIIQPTSVQQLVSLAIAKSRDLASDAPTDIVSEIPPNLPPVAVDAAYGPRALAVFISHAMQGVPAASGRRARLSARLAKGGSGDTAPMVRIRLRYPEGAIGPEKLAAQLRGESPSVAGRGMALRLGLARSLVDLHRGQVTVERSPHGAAVVSCWFPVAEAIGPRSRQLSDTEFREG